jgi:small-conductance mechanosensitive channel
MWVQSRQYTGRLVTVSNARVFDEPVYNYTREIPVIWEEIAVPIRYQADRERVEHLLLAIADRHADEAKHLSAEDREELSRRYVIGSTDVKSHVYYRLTDNWLELTVRFLAPAHGVRELKDAISRDILRGLDELGIEIASATLELAALPPIRVRLDHDSGDRPAQRSGGPPSAHMRSEHRELGTPTRR